MKWQYSVIPDLTDAQYLRWQDILEERTGIYFAQHKSILQAGLTQRMREVGCLDYEKYYAKVTEKVVGAIEWAALLNALTVKETSFFRHYESFQYIKTYLKDLVNDGGNELGLWSVGCSTGEEAYSLAITAHSCIEQHCIEQNGRIGSSNDVNKAGNVNKDNNVVRFGVTGSDISSTAVDQARKGNYLRHKLETVSEQQLQRYFEVVDDGNVRIVPWLRQQMCFVHSNVVDMQSMPISEMDVIFCQNMLIYFKPERQHEVLDNLAARLKMGGILVLGLGEAINWQNPAIKRLSQEKVQVYVRL